MSFLAALQPRSVLVFRALQLGDMLCAVPALRALRKALPAAHVALVGLPWAREFAARFRDYLDEFIAFPGFDGLPEQTPDAVAWPGFVAALCARRFDLALQLHGDGRLTNRIVARFGAAQRAGFGAPATHGAGFLEWPPTGAEVTRLVRLLEALGAPPAGLRLEFPLGAEDRAELARAGFGGLPRGGYVCLHPGARAAARRWPVGCFAALGRRLHDASGLRLVITGSGAERALGEELAAGLGVPGVVNAAAPISIGAMAALIAGSRLLVANDTGVSHIAAGLGVPSVIVFSASDAERWAPLDRQRHRVVHAAAGDAVAAALHQARALLAASLDA
jgi:ADP-heptose:LPS heptosyltransferase